jgi:hypothetical protein
MAQILMPQAPYLAKTPAATWKAWLAAHLEWPALEIWGEFHSFRRKRKRMRHPRDVRSRFHFPDHYFPAHAMQQRSRFLTFSGLTKARRSKFGIAGSEGRIFEPEEMDFLSGAKAQ